MSSRPLLEKTLAAQSVEHPYDTLVRWKIARLVRSHVQVKCGPRSEAGQKRGDPRLFDMKSAGLATDSGEQMRTRKGHILEADVGRPLNNFADPSMCYVRAVGAPLPYRVA